MDIRLIIQAIKVKIALNRLSRMKENAVRVHMGLEPILPWYQTCYINFMTSIRETICMTFCPCFIYDRFRHLKKLEIPKSPWKRLFREGTFENEMMSCCLGFLGGIVLTMLVYLMMILQFEFKPLTSSVVCSIFGLFATFGIAFSLRCRCIALLMIPTLFSSNGRAFLLLYIMILVMTHPVVNFNNNIMVMSNSATCGQQLAYNQTKELVENAVAPLAGVMGSIRQLLASLREFSNALRESFTALKKAIEEISAVIDRVFVWLGSIETVCNEKMGQPYRKCKKAFDDAYVRCTDTLGWFLSWLCKIVEVASNLCHIARVTDALCIIAAAIKNFVLGSISRPFRKTISEVYDMFYFNVSIYYKYSFNATQSKTYSQVKEDILKDVKERLKNFTGMVNIVEFVMMFAILFVFIKAIMYRLKYLINDRFDNIYITYKVRDIDERRMELRKECILPLKFKERGNYIYSRSIYMASVEKRKMAKGIVLLVLSMCYAGFYMTCDYGLFWLLSMMKKHLSIKTHSSIPPHLKMHVQGTGALADMYRALLTMFDPLAEGNIDIDTTPCLPEPYIPNFAVYKEIGVLYGVCLFLVIFEAYGLRFRHIIAGCYYPERERARAVWLYNHIIKMRGDFLKFARRQMRRNSKTAKENKGISIRSRLAAQFPIARKIFKYFGWNRKSCLGCGKEGRVEDEDNFTHCMNNECQAVYCIECFTDLNNLCTVCMNPIDYGDFSDFSEERDSSEDEEEMLKRKIKANERKARRKKQQEKNTPEHKLKGFRLIMGLTDSKIQEQADAMRENHFDENEPIVDSFQGNFLNEDQEDPNNFFIDINESGDFSSSKIDTGKMSFIEGENIEQKMSHMKSGEFGNREQTEDDDYFFDKGEDIEAGRSSEDERSEWEYDDDYQYADKNARSVSVIEPENEYESQPNHPPSRLDLVTEDIFESEFVDNDSTLDLSLSEPEDIEMDREIVDNLKTI